MRHGDTIATQDSDNTKEAMKTSGTMASHSKHMLVQLHLHWGQSLRPDVSAMGRKVADARTSTQDSSGCRRQR
eukprot:1633901-Amphidinium_carterae.1